MSHHLALGSPHCLTAHRSPREVSEDHVLSNDVATRTGSSPDARDRNGGSYPSSAPCSGSVSPRRPRSAMLVQTEDAQEPPLAPGHLVCQPWRGSPRQAHAPPPHSPPFGWDSGRGPSFWRCWRLALIFSRASHLKCDYFHRTCYFCVDPQRWGIKRGSVAHLTSRPACWLAAPALPPPTPPACLNLCRVPTLSLVMWILFISKIPTLCHMY